MRIPLRTTLDEELLNFLRYKALELKVDMNDILEALAEKYKNKIDSCFFIIPPL